MWCLSPSGRKYYWCGPLRNKAEDAQGRPIKDSSGVQLYQPISIQDSQNPGTWSTVEEDRKRWLGKNPKPDRRKYVKDVA